MRRINDGRELVIYQKSVKHVCKSRKMCKFVD